MSILRALQKKRTEDPNGEEPNRRKTSSRSTRTDDVQTEPPDLLSERTLRIGNPGSAFIGQPDSADRDGTP